MEDIENHKIVRILKTKRILAILFYDEAVTDRSGSCFFMEKPSLQRFLLTQRGKL